MVVSASLDGRVLAALDDCVSTALDDRVSTALDGGGWEYRGPSEVEALLPSAKRIL